MEAADWGVWSESSIPISFDFRVFDDCIEHWLRLPSEPPIFFNGGLSDGSKKIVVYFEDIFQNYTLEFYLVPNKKLLTYLEGYLQICNVFSHLILNFPVLHANHSVKLFEEK